jgi:predicted TIM-barrel fold metal-dependent hydrolase
MTGAMSGERALVISADGHAGAPMREYRPYLDAEFRDDFDAYASEYETRMGGSRITPPKHFFNPKVIEPYEERMIASGAIDGEFDPAVRIDRLESDGIAAEIIFPNQGPFGIGFGPANVGAPDHARAAARAYNRWIVDFCAGRTDRLGGQALLTFLDIDEDLETIHAAAASGLKGLVIPGVDTTGRIPMLWDEALDPIWAACEDTGLPVNLHAGVGIPTYTSPRPGMPAKVLIMLIGTEFPWFAHRPLWFLVYGAVFERHPALKVVFTEQHCDWIPGILARLDYSYTNFGTDDLWGYVPRKPSEYFASNCWVGASILSRAEAELRYDIGVDRMMFGADFPHVEGAWGQTTQYLQATIGHAGMTPPEARQFLGATAADVFGFDTDALAEVAARCGPSLDDVLTPSDAMPTPDVRRPPL